MRKLVIWISYGKKREVRNEIDEYFFRSCKSRDSIRENPDRIKIDILF